MMTKKQKQTLIENNRRSREIAQESIQQAFFQLLVQKPFEKISVTDIINRSGISRSAFYRNYKTKEDILEASISYLIHEILKNVTGDVHEDLLTILKEIARHRSQVELLFKARLEHLLLDALNGWFFPDEKFYIHIIWSGIIFNTVYIWITQKPDTDYKEIANYIYEALQRRTTEKVSFINGDVK